MQIGVLSPDRQISLKGYYRCMSDKRTIPNMKTFDDLVAEASTNVTELMPWELSEKIQQQSNLVLIDVREANEFNVHAHSK